MADNDRDPAPIDRARRPPAGIWTGIEAIDDAHERLLKELRVAVTQAEDPIKALREMQRHVWVHFEQEEAAMAAAGYPELEAHKQEHAKLGDFVAEISIELVSRGQDAEYVAVSNRVLFNWLVDHIKNADTDFASFLRNGRAARRRV